MAGDELQAARRACHAGERGDGALRIAARRDDEAQGGQSIGRLEAADQRQVELMAPAQHLDRKMLPGRRRLAFQQPHLAALRAVGPEAHAASPADRRQGLDAVAVGVHDRRAARRQQFLEQPRLGREIVVHGSVIVEMLVGQVGKAGGREAKAIEAVLIQPVARRLDRKMGNALARQSARDPHAAARDQAWSGRRRASAPTRRCRAYPRWRPAGRAPPRCDARSGRSRTCRWCR